MADCWTQRGRTSPALAGRRDLGLLCRVVTELMEGGQWAELNDRFFKTLAFGTGGLRGRTIGKIVTAAERGTPRRAGAAGVPMRRHERDELLQHQPRDAGAGGLSAASGLPNEQTCRASRRS